jgi:predicted oxidoreductase
MISDAIKVNMDRQSWFELYTSSFNTDEESWRLP